jgi:hypothetical protein
MAQANLVRGPLLLELGEVAAVLAIVASGEVCGGSGAMGSFFFLLPPAVAGGLVIGCGEGMVGVSMVIVIGIPSVWGGRGGGGTIVGGCKCQTGSANTILGRVSVVAT